MARRVKFTQAGRDRFLAVLRETANVSAAARAAGISRSRAYQVKDSDPEFAAAWVEALDEALDALEAEALRRAAKGVETPVFYQGRECGSVTRYSDALTMFMLRAHRPEKYSQAGGRDQDQGPAGVILEMNLSGDPDPEGEKD
ncbi:MAG: hypothetical protein PHV85_05105 [Desulfovibrionaceae bacterium]|nr:hypothetical protein [Desulfovibrionaceae bacterium]MDD4951907.1 hypothetical protein [Desulfovibrionaceae bacterium]